MQRSLFDKRGALYSSRPDNYIGAELITRENVHLLLMPYGKDWRMQRKIYQTILNINAVTSLQELQEAEASLTLWQLAHGPQDYYDHIRRYSTAVILSSVFGLRGPDFHHPNIQRLYHVQDQFTAILETGATPPVDIFPILRYLPTFLASWKKQAAKIRLEQRQLYFELLQNVQQRREKGQRRNCFMDNLLDETKRDNYNLDDEHIAYIGGVLMEGGSDTTASTLLSFILAMIKYPAVLNKAQEEIDAICGSGRSPNFQIVKELPYLKNCMTEVNISPFFCARTCAPKVQF
jgi:cytochrome P450